ncbi:MAG: hypothetical protein OET18_08390 [Desulfobacterales bacterium]|nr:hypothetical protein [Desulfobacterales bacterium]
MKKIIFITSLIFTTTACTSGFSTIGISTSYFKESQDDYKTDYKPKASIIFNHIVEVNKKAEIGYSTNRFDNLIFDRNTYNITLKSGIKGINQQKITTDTLLLGKRFGRWLPMVNLTNARVDNKFIINNNVKRNINTAILFGASATYFINKEYSISSAYIFGNQELGIDGGFLITVSMQL